MSSEEKNIPRVLKISLPRAQSAFLWGARKTGKTTLLQEKFPNSLRYDLLETDTFLRLSKEPFRLREELLAVRDRGQLAKPIIIDEVQKIPPLLDEIHWLIENKKLSFILCGSSARKLKRSHANMLGGRAWRFELHPLTSFEIGKDFDLLKGLNRGLIPSHYLSNYYPRNLKAYIQDYLKEEIQYEGIVRNLPAFARFLDAVSFSSGELVNYTNIARECGVDAKTVAEYYQILIDTLIGHFLEPYRKRRGREIITATPKFYLFDVGVAGSLTKRILQTNQGAEFGKAFEHLVMMELIAYRSYTEKDVSIRFWRTKAGQEVDFVIAEGEVAIEVKGSRKLSSADLAGLKAFVEEHRPKKALLVCQEPVARKLSSGLEIVPWKEFFKTLWAGEIF
jgi:predicted AAA+ superfamily ATPase